MRKTKLSAAIITVLTAVSLCGCANVDGEKPTAPSSEVSQQTSEMISSLTDGSFDELFYGGETSGATGDNSAFPTKCKIYKQTMKLFTEEQLISLFSETPERTEDGYGHIFFKTDREDGLMDGEGYLRFATPAGNKFETICATDFLKENNIEGYEDEELEFATRAEVLEQLKTLLRDNFGVAPEDWYVQEFYGVKKETVDLYKEELLKEANEPVTSDNVYEHEKVNEWAKAWKTISGDDYYFISLGIKIDDIPTYSGGLFFYGPNDGSAISANMSKFVFTKNGIEYAVFNYMRETDKASAEEADIISPDEARALMRQKIDSVIWDGEIEIYDMKMVYLPIPQNDLEDVNTNFDTRPFYAFYYSMPEKVDDKVIFSDVVTYFDAVTGEELGTEWL